MNGYTTNNETLYFVDYHPYGLPSMVHTLNVWASDVLDAKNKFWDEIPRDDHWVIVGVSRPGMA
ncbi:MAG: hypothetical protein ACYTFK_13890 [Planctomycetota bacterium]|jgi:hypothetical protein